MNVLSTLDAPGKLLGKGLLDFETQFHSEEAESGHGLGGCGWTACAVEWYLDKPEPAPGAELHVDWRRKTCTRFDGRVFVTRNPKTGDTGASKE